MKNYIKICALLFSTFTLSASQPSINDLVGILKLQEEFSLDEEHITQLSFTYENNSLKLEFTRCKHDASECLTANAQISEFNGQKAENTFNALVLALAEYKKAQLKPEEINQEQPSSEIQEIKEAIQAEKEEIKEETTIENGIMFENATVIVVPATITESADVQPTSETN